MSSPISTGTTARASSIVSYKLRVSFGAQVERFMVPIVFTCFVVFRALDRVLLIRVSKIMGNDYAGTLMNLYWPVSVQLITACFTCGYVIKKRYVDEDERYGLSFFSLFSPLASSRGVVPMIWMATFSFWDQLNAAIQAIPQVWIADAEQVALTNTVVVWTALIAYFYLGSRFKQVHYAGCLLILISCVVAVNVQLASQGLPQPVADARVIETSTGVMTIIYLVYLIGVVPSAASNCYKQKVTKGVDLDLMWATFWAGNFQVLWGLLMYPINWIPYPMPGHTNSQSPATLVSDLADSWACFTGHAPTPANSSCTTDSAWLWFIWYLTFNVFFNLLMLWLTKYLSATWASIGNVLCGDLFGVFGQFGFVSGNATQVMPLAQWLSLALSSMAMWVYNIEDEVNADGKVVYGVPDGSKTEEEGGACCETI